MGDKIRISSKYDMHENYEPSDSDNEFSAREKKLLAKVHNKNNLDSDSAEEVYAFSESDDSDVKDDLGIADSDVEGQEKSDDDLPNPKAWGKKRKSYYSTDYIDEDYGGFGDEEQAALMEEEEAKNIQKKLLEQLGDEDFSLNFFEDKSVECIENALITTDLSQMSKRQKIQLFEKESPEFSGLVDDFKTKLSVAKVDLQPVLELAKEGKLPKCSALQFVKTNYKLILNYCTNISFYLLLKSQRINIQNHPVIKRLYQYRQMFNKMEPIYLEVIKPQIDHILQTMKNNSKLSIIHDDDRNNKKRKLENVSQLTCTKKIKLLDVTQKNDDEDTGVSDDEDGVEQNFPDQNDIHRFPRGNESEESGFSDNDLIKEDDIKISRSQDISNELIGDKRREITYQIAKNKGLTPRRKKEQRNPRVKHKLKYRKAKIRRRGAVREVRTEINRYGGETSGIKANVKKSIKIK